MKGGMDRLTDIHEGGREGKRSYRLSFAHRWTYLYQSCSFSLNSSELGDTTSVDYADSKLTELNEGLVGGYLSTPYVETKCYSCSDRASWEKT